LICSKLKIISILFMSIAMEEHFRQCLEGRTLFNKNQLYSSLNNLLKHSKYWINIISCIGIWNQVIYSFIMGWWRLAILDFARVWRKHKWPKQCLVHLSTWHLKYLMDRFTQIKLIFGQLVWYFTKCFMGIAHLNRVPFQS
jgi:hypothetical protein